MNIIKQIVRFIKKILSTLIIFTAKPFRTGDHLSRYYMYKRLENVLGGLNNDGTRKRVLSISSSNKLLEYLPFKDAEIVEADYPEHNILDLSFPDNYFDYVVSDQVLEHIEGDPFKAINESWRVLKEGGVAVHTTCFFNEIHPCPNDYWRFTPEGLALLCGKFGKVIDAGGWGNIIALFLIWLGARYCPIPESKWHPIHMIATLNNKLYPISTWVVARK